MAGSHLSGGSSAYGGRSRSRRRRGGAGKVIILIIALIIIVAVAGYFVASNVFGIDILGGFSLGGSSSADVSINGTTVSIQDASGKNVTGNVSVTAGTSTPDELENPTVISTTWTGMMATKYPVIISVTNPTFTNDDGLAIYQYNGTSWNELGTFLIKDNTVSFQVYTLSQFAFEVVSSEPDPTPTPEPTETPEPTSTPEPVDYGDYSTEVEGLYVDTTFLAQDGEYIIGVLHDDDEDDMYATIILHYSEDELDTVDVAIAQTDSGRYYISDPVVEGMLWTAANSDDVNGLTRCALANNEKYLNLNEDCDEFILDDDPDGRTRWAYENIAADGTETVLTDEETEVADDSVTTLSYYNEEILYFLESSKKFTATSDIDDGLQMIVFCLNGSNTATELSDEETEEATTTKSSSGVTSLTAEPDNVKNVNATSKPTTPTPAQTHNSNLVPTVTSDPTAVPSTTDAPQATDDSGSTGGGDTGGGSASPSDTSTDTGGSDSGEQEIDVGSA